MEKLLKIWMNEKQLADDSVSQDVLCETANQLHDGVFKKTSSRLRLMCSKLEKDALIILGEKWHTQSG